MSKNNSIKINKKSNKNIELQCEETDEDTEEDFDDSQNEEKIIQKFSCKYCNYNTDKPSDWLKHCKSQKHKRMGKSKTHKCPDCDYICKTAWNMKLHILSQHSTKEARSNQKYYCADCDLVFFSANYYERHITGIRHKNFVNAILEQEKIK